MNADSGKVDLPVATEGTEQWAATVAKAMSYGAKDSGAAMTNFQNFQSKVMSNLQKQVGMIPIFLTSVIWKITRASSTPFSA